MKNHNDLMETYQKELGMSFPKVEKHYHLINFSNLNELVRTFGNSVFDTAVGMVCAFLVPISIVLSISIWQYTYLHALHPDVPRELSCKNHEGFLNIIPTSVNSEYKTVLCKDGYTYPV